MPGLPQPARVPRLRTQTRIGTGNRTYRFGLAPREQYGGPEPIPPGFVTPTTSKTEWYPYWALATIYGMRNSGRDAPFLGDGVNFLYQADAMGGRNQGGAVVDYVILRPRSGRILGIRLQTERFHLEAPVMKRVSDEIQRASLEASMDVVDIYEYVFIGDKSGQAVMQTIKYALGLIEVPNPLAAGVVQRNR